MPLQEYHAASSDRDDPTGRNDQPPPESAVPPALSQLFERSKREPSAPKPLDVFSPDDWPPCPDCADRLVATAVATDTQDTLVAAAMRCYNSVHETTRYVYDVRTGDLYFDQVLADRQPTAPEG